MIMSFIIREGSDAGLPSSCQRSAKTGPRGTRRSNLFPPLSQPRLVLETGPPCVPPPDRQVIWRGRRATWDGLGRCRHNSRSISKARIMPRARARRPGSYSFCVCLRLVVRPVGLLRRQEVPWRGLRVSPGSPGRRAHTPMATLAKREFVTSARQRGPGAFSGHGREPSAGSVRACVVRAGTLHGPWSGTRSGLTASYSGGAAARLVIWAHPPKPPLGRRDFLPGRGACAVPVQERDRGWGRGSVPSRASPVSGCPLSDRG